MNKYALALTSGEQITVEADRYEYPDVFDVYSPVHFYDRKKDDPIHTFNLGVIAYIMLVGDTDDD